MAKSLDRDIEQFSNDFNNFGTPFTAIDSQNRIWIKILNMEKLSKESKRKHLMI